MSGRQAKRLRHKVYGEEFSPRARRYFVGSNGQLVADPKRRAYQKVKRGFDGGRRGGP